MHFFKILKNIRHQDINHYLQQLKRHMILVLMVVMELEIQAALINPHTIRIKHHLMMLILHHRTLHQLINRWEKQATLLMDRQ